MEARLEEAYAHAPPLSREEWEEASRLARCFAGAVLGVGGGCSAEREAARASGLFERNRIGAARYDIPDLVTRASAQSLGAERTNNLLVALLTAEAAEAALRGYFEARLSDEERDAVRRGTHYVQEPGAVAALRRDPLAMSLVSADIQQALVCDSEDLANGRRAGSVYDPHAPVPAGP